MYAETRDNTPAEATTNARCAVSNKTLAERSAGRLQRRFGRVTLALLLGQHAHEGIHIHARALPEARDVQKIREIRVLMVLTELHQFL